MDIKLSLDAAGDPHVSPGNGKPPSILLVSAPGFAHGWSPLSIARLKSFLRATGFRATCLPLCVLFTDHLRRRAPRLMSIDADIGEFGTSWHEAFYSGMVFGHARPEDLLLQSLADQHANVDIYRTYLDFAGGVRCEPEASAVAADFRRTKRYCALMHSFLCRVLDKTDWSAYDAVGFSCLDTQFLTSLYLAREIRRRHGPRPRIVFGGELFQSYNTAQFLENFPEIDHILVGQAEEALAALLTQIGNGGASPRLSGTMPDRGAYRYKRNEPDRIDFFPTPDFSELRHRRVANYSLTLSLGGGCSNSGCAFCPISSVGQHLRPPKAIIEDIRRLYAAHGRREINFVDWEINGDPRHLEELCDLAIQERLTLMSWGEINSRNTSPSLLTKMRRAGIRRVQVGIESFSEDTLRLIGKRATLVDNIKVLKWGTEAKLDAVLFNVLCNHPLSSAQDPGENLRVMRLISHLLRRPVLPVLNEVSLYRTSRLYRQAERFRLGGMKQFDYHRRLYPPSLLRREIPMFSLAYDALPVAPLWEKVGTLLAKLKRAPVTLTARRLKNGATVIHDSRGRRRRRYRLNGPEGDVLWEAMEDTPQIAAIAAKLAKPQETVASAVGRLVRRGLVVQSRDRVLSLPLKAGVRR